MRYLELLTAPQHGLEAVWLSLSARAEHYRVLPDGRCDVIVQFDAGVRPLRPIAVLIAGPATRFYDVAHGPEIGFVGARLRPGYAAPLLGLEPSSLVDGRVVGEAALARWPALRPLYAPAQDGHEIAARLLAWAAERIAAARFQPDGLLRDLLGSFHGAGGRLRIHDTAARHQVSERTVQRLLREAIGLPPKTFANILQFHHALRLLSEQRLSPAEAALQAGFADQAHMSRVFRRLGGFTPGRRPELTLVNIRG